MATHLGLISVGVVAVRLVMPGDATDWECIPTMMLADTMGWGLTLVVVAMGEVVEADFWCHRPHLW